MDYLPDYPDGYFDLAIPDPPAGIGEDGRKDRSGYVKQKNGNKIWVDSAPDFERWDNEPPDQNYFDQLFRTSEHQIIWCENYLDFDQKNQSSGRIFWDKVNGDSDQSDGELAWTSLFDHIRQVEYMWSGMFQGESLRNGRKQQGNKSLNEKRLQRCHKPVLLYLWCFQLPAVQKMVESLDRPLRVLDTHVGGGSSLIACEIMGFEYVGFEIGLFRYTNSLHRLKTHLQQPELFTPEQQPQYEQGELFKKS